MLHVALYQPVIPPNVGSVARTCIGMGAHLHLIGPLSLDLSESRLKRAGLDYWEHLTLTVHDSPEAFLAWAGNRRLWLVSKFGSVRYDQADYASEDVLVLGSEKAGLPAAWAQRHARHCLYVPIAGGIRSYNLSNTAAMVLAQACSTAGLFDLWPHEFAPERPDHGTF